MKKQKSKSEVPTDIKTQSLVRKRRKQIIDVAIDLFIQHGYQKTSTRMIATTASVSTGSLYEYIKSKDDLLYLVCKEIHEEIYNAVNNALSDKIGTEGRLSIMIKEYFLLCDKLSKNIGLMYKVSQFLAPKWKKRIFENEQDITQIFSDELSQLSKKDQFPKLTADQISIVSHNIAVLGQMWAFRHWFLRKHYTIDEYISIQTNFILGSIFK